MLVQLMGSSFNYWMETLSCLSINSHIMKKFLRLKNIVTNFQIFFLHQGSMTGNCSHNKLYPCSRIMTLRVLRYYQIVTRNGRNSRSAMTVLLHNPDTCCKKRNTYFYRLYGPSGYILDFSLIKFLLKLFGLLKVITKKPDQPECDILSRRDNVSPKVLYYGFISSHSDSFEPERHINCRDSSGDNNGVENVIYDQNRCSR